MSSNTNGGFLHDEPLKEIDDEYRSGLSIKVVETLLATNNIDSSFAFAVMGEWGSGKTTFLNQIIKELKEKKHECNIIIFNPWQVEDSTSITKEFFVALADELNKMVVGLKIEVEDYASSLINESKTGFVQSLLTKTIFLFGKENKALADKHESIQNAISATGKKLFIVIDDLDRLDTAEIKEVFRIIRNSASFGNVIFLVAFDINQIDKAIGDNNVNGVKYLDKIFQAGVLMNSYRKGAIRDFLIKNLQGVLSEDDLKLLTNESAIKKFSFQYFEKLLINIRDAKRYLNQIKIYYPLFSEAVYFPDFYRLLFIKLRFPDMFRYIFLNKEKFFTTYGIDLGDKKYARLSIVRKNQSGKYEYNNKENTYANSPSLLNEELAVLFGTSKADIIQQSFEILFSNEDADDFGGYATKVNRYSESLISKEHLSIVINKNFDTYFDLDNTSLTHAMFIEAFDLNGNQLKSVIHEWFEKSWQGEFDFRIQRVNSFETKELFENLLQGIIYAAEYPDANAYSSQAYYSRLLLSKILPLPTFNYSSIGSLFSNEEAYSKFLETFFEKNIDSLVVVVLIEYILSQNNGTIREEIFSSGSLLKILILGLGRQIEKGNVSLDSSFIERYFNISRYLPQDDLKLKRLNDIIIKDVVPYNIDSFIQNVILKQNDREKVYTFDDTLLKIFNSDLQVMLNNLEPYLSKAKYGKDFKNFTDSVINRGSQGWFSFEFETLQDSLLYSK